MQPAADRRIEVLPYESEHEREWDELVNGSINGTVFHTRRFLAYHPRDRFQDASLLCRVKGKLVAVLPAARVDEAEGRVLLNSHPGASYGGPVFTRKASATLVFGVLEAIEEQARRAGFDALQMRLPPHVFHGRPFATLEFALRFRGFHIARTELTSCVDLDTAVTDPMLGFTTNCRNQLRQAMRASLESGESEDYAQFWAMLEENLRARHDVTPTHTLEEILRLRDLLGEAIRLFATWQDGRLLAGTVVFVCNQECAHTFYMASLLESQHLRPLNLALHRAMTWARDRGLRRLNLGVSTPDGESVNWGLLHFKEGFGARGVCRDTYRKDLG